MFHLETLASENIAESRNARFAPFGFVVTRNHVMFHFQLVEDIFCFLKRCAVSLFGDIARYQNKINVVACIDLIHDPLQVFIGIAAIGDVQIGQKGKTKCIVRLTGQKC